MALHVFLKTGLQGVEKFVALFCGQFHGGSLSTALGAQPRLTHMF
jgi:hypothetical protein